MPTENEKSTELRAFLSKRGMLMVKQFKNVGSMQGLYRTNASFDAVNIFAPGQLSSKVSGLRITISSHSDFEREETVFLDRDEVESLVSALVYAKQTADEWTKDSTDYTEVVFATKDDFTVGFFQQGRDQQAFAKCGYGDGISMFFVETGDLLVLRAICDKAQKQLAES